MGEPFKDETRVVVDEVARTIELHRAQGRPSIQFVRYIAENDLAPAAQGLVDHIERARVVDLYRDDAKALIGEPGTVLIVMHLDRSLARASQTIHDHLQLEGTGDWVLLVSPDDVKAMVDGEFDLWRRRDGFHSWPRTRATHAPGGAGRVEMSESLTADMMKEVIRTLEGEPEDLDELTRQRAFTMSLNLLRQKQFEEARRILMRLIHALKAQGDIQSLATAYVLVGNITFEMNNYRNAIEWYNEAQAFIEKLNDDIKLSDLYHQRGYARFLLGEHKAALDDFRRALTIDEALNDDFRKSLIYRRIGIALDLVGSLDEAEIFFRQAVEIETRLKNEAGIARAYQHLGRVAEKRGDHDGAAEHYERSLEIKRRMNDERGLASLYHQYGNLRFAQEEFRDALTLYRKALVLEERHSDFQSLARTLIQVGLTQEQPQQPKEAVATLRKASTLLTKLNSPIVEKIASLIQDLESRAGDDLHGVFGDLDDEG